MMDATNYRRPSKNIAYEGFTKVSFRSWEIEQEGLQNKSDYFAERKPLFPKVP